MAKFIPFILIILLVGCSKFTVPTVSRPVKSTSHEPQTEQKEQAPKFVTPSSEPTEVQEKEIEQTAPETSTASNIADIPVESSVSNISSRTRRLKLIPVTKDLYFL
ncbi:MAG: hypothetical protein RSA50_05410, partial [Mucinivorans sp.]